MPKARIIQLGLPELASVNPTKEPLTIEKFRQLSDMKNFSDQEASEMVHSIHLLAKLLYDFVRKSKLLALIINK